MFSRLVVGAAFTLAANALSAQSFSDTTIGYRFGDYFREPGVADGRHPRGVNIDKSILNIGHADAWQSYPLDFQKFVPLRIDGFANFNSPKGTDGFGAKTQ